MKSDKIKTQLKKNNIFNRFIMFLKLIEGCIPLKLVLEVSSDIVIVAFPDHTYLLFVALFNILTCCLKKQSPLFPNFIGSLDF